MTLPGYDDWLDNHGNPGIQDEDPEDYDDNPMHSSPERRAVWEGGGDPDDPENYDWPEGES